MQTYFKYKEILHWSFQGSQQGFVCAWNHCSDAPRQRAGGGKSQNNDQFHKITVFKLLHTCL